MVSTGWETRSNLALVLAHGTSWGYSQMLAGAKSSKAWLGWEINFQGTRLLAQSTGSKVSAGYCWEASLSFLLHGPLRRFAVRCLEDMKVVFLQNERAKRAKWMLQCLLWLSLKSIHHYFWCIQLVPWSTTRVENQEAGVTGRILEAVPHCLSAWVLFLQ